MTEIHLGTTKTSEVHLLLLLLALVLLLLMRRGV